MNYTLKTSLPVLVLATLALSSAAYADDVPKAADPATAPTPAAAPPGAAPAPAPAPPALLPALAGPLGYSAKPLTVDLGPLGNKVYITGVASGIALAQSHPLFEGLIGGDKKTLVDITNGQVFIQKVDGQFQYFVQVGIYSLPSLGVPYGKAAATTGNTYGALPQAFVKWAPTDAFSVQVGKLPTLIGAEYTFSYENLNVERGLLWGQENAVNRGVQLNYTKGPLALSVSWNDNFYSNKFSSVSALATWTINSANTISGVFSASTKKIYTATAATPLLQNNQQTYNLIYSYTSGNWFVQPYIQYTHVPDLALNGTTSASTFGGAVLAKYTLNSHFSIPARVEYIGSSGKNNPTAANLLGYGIGSKAWSLTLTPTYQYNNLFARVEGSYVKATSAIGGFGPLGDKTDQARLLIEGGVVF